MRVIYWPRTSMAPELVGPALADVAGVEVQTIGPLDELLAAIPGASGLITSDEYGEGTRAALQAMGASGTMRWLHILNAGRDRTESEGIPPGLVVTDSVGAVAPTVAEHAMGMFLSLARRLHQGYARMPGKQWDRAIGSANVGTLEGRTLLIVGMGQIGRELAKRARPFGMRVIAINRTVRDEPEVERVLPLSALHETLPMVDALALAIAHKPETHHLIGAAELALCRPALLLVNVGRGGLVDQVALRAALDEDRIAGAGLDTVTPEPLPSDDPLWGAKNLLISCHYGGAGSQPSMERLARIAADNLAKFRDGKLA